jgi:hypothetical protein
VPDLLIPAPEVQLLCACARTQADAAEICALLQDGVDWDALTALAVRHGTLSLLYWNLDRACPAAVPAQVLADLRKAFQANARRNLFLTAELLEILDRLEAGGIRALAFRGPVLAATLYGNLALRQFIDLDILIEKRDLPRVATLLGDHGYRPASGAARPTRGCEISFINAEKQVGVDLHWELINRYILSGLDLERLWGRLAPVSLAGRSVPGLPPEDLLLVLCAHAVKHGPTPSGRLMWFSDLAELLAAHPLLDWDCVVARARRRGARRVLFLGLTLARDLVGAALPEMIQDQIAADPAVAPLAARVRDHLFAPPGVFHRGDKRLVFYLRMRERRRDRISSLFHLARGRDMLTPNAGDRTFVSLPPTLSFLYYLLRPVRLVKDHGRQISTAIWTGK